MITAMATRMRNSRFQRGMTLMEVVVVIAVVGFIAVAMTAAIGGIFGARLDAGANKLSGMARYAYSRALLTGKVHRLVVDLEAGTYRLEEVEDKKDCSVLNFRADEEKKETIDEDDPVALMAALAGTSIKDAKVRTEKLDAGVQFTGIFTRHNSNVVEEGSESIHFFPDGTAEKAFVWLTDDNEVFTVEITALQGTGVVHDEELDAVELTKR